MNNKGEKILVFALGALVGVFLFFWFVPKANEPVGVSLNDVSYTSVTPSTVSCGSNVANGTGTAITGKRVGRLSFEALNPNLTAVYVCKVESNEQGCLKASSTIAISATTSVDMPISYIQGDNYGGGYSCVSDGVTTTINIQQAL